MKGCSGRAAIVGFAVLLSAATARGTVTYRSGGGCNLGGQTCDFGLLLDEQTPPSTSTSFHDFSWGGAACPAPTTHDYACGYFFGQATLDYMGLTLRASSNLRRHDAALGAERVVTGTAEITVTGMTGSVATPTTGFAKFHFGLAGTFSTTRSDPAVVIDATAYSFLVADAQHFLQCTGTNCGGVVAECALGADCVISVPYSTVTPGMWNPGYYIVHLNTGVSLAADPQTLAGWDATGFVNFQDTVALTAIEIEDSDHQPVPGAYFTIPDADGNGNPFVVPTQPPPSTTSTTTTTVATTTSVTATTTSAHPPTTTTTVVSPATTTTTTLPGATCVHAATLPSIDCRLGQLQALVRSDVPPGALQNQLLAALSQARIKTGQVEALRAAGKKHPARSAVGHVISALDSFKQRLKSHAARHLSAKTMLLADVADVLKDLRAVRHG